MRGDFDERNGSVVGVSDERLNGESGRLGERKTAPGGAQTPCAEGLTPTEEGLMNQSTFSHRQTALGGAE